MVRVSSPAKLRPWSELTAKMVMGVVPGLVNQGSGGTPLFTMNKSPKRSFCATMVHEIIAPIIYKGMLDVVVSATWPKKARSKYLCNCNSSFVPWETRTPAKLISLESSCNCSCDLPREYHCILHCYPINSKMILWGHFKITPLKMNFDEIFWRQFLPQRLPALASLHSMLQKCPA